MACSLDSRVNSIDMGLALILNLRTQNSNLYLKSKNFWVYFSLSVLFFWTLVFTKSRSGLLGFGAAFLIFWVGYFWINRKDYKKHLISFIVIGASLFAICLISGTEFTPSIGSLIHKSANSTPQTAASGETSLETGGTESSAIRKIVWKGAIQIWLHYPVFGTGVETFAYSYFKYRPPEHNLTSEWDYIYNKAHNEYLNFLANDGIVGLLAYLALIWFSIYQIINLKTQNSNIKSIFQNSKLTRISDLQFSFEVCNLRFALLAGYASLLVTNFFGFSVVPTQLELFLFPAVAIIIANNQPSTNNSQLKKPEGIQKFLLLIVVGCVLMVVFAIGKYWYADTLYAMGKAYNGIARPDVATNYLGRAINLEPRQPWYYNELANSYASLTVAFDQSKDTTNSQKFADLAIAESDKTVSLSPTNFIFKMSRFGVFIMLSTINPNYLTNAQATIIDAINAAPTYAKLYYNLGLTYARTNQNDLAIKAFQKAIELKANYGDARLAYVILLVNEKQNAEAKVQLEYILTKIDPNNSLAKQTLAGIK